MIKLVASDMDGTLLGEDGAISKRNAQAIRALESRGIRFVVCTGRACEDARLPLAAQELDCDIICMNGAAVYDKDGMELSRQALSRSQVECILACCEGDWEVPVCFDFMTNHGSCTLSTREQFRSFYEDNILLPMAGGIDFDFICSRFRFVNREALFAEGVEIYKMSVIHPSPFVLERIKGKLSGDAHLAIAASHHTNLEITDSGAQKGVALMKYAQMKGIRAGEIMALGDSENDLSMLKLPLGYTIAMENAMESVKRIARCQTRSNVEDGVAYAIETMLLAPKEQVS